MAKYLFHCSYTQEGLKGFLKDSSNAFWSNQKHLTIKQGLSDQFLGAAESGAINFQNRIG